MCLKRERGREQWMESREVYDRRLTWCEITTHLKRIVAKPREKENPSCTWKCGSGAILQKESWDCRST